MAEILHIESALELQNGEEEVLTELLKKFLSEKPFSKAELNLLESKNLQEAADYIHYYKNFARQLGAEKLVDVGKLLENAILGRIPMDVMSLNDEFEKVYFSTVETIRETLEILLSDKIES